jgi:membrane protein implicated in regulation of membrane protease activity
MSAVWFIAAGALLVVELFTADLLFASLAISALAAAGVSAMGFDFIWQGLAFGLTALLSLALLRPIALKHLKKSTPEMATGIDALIGVEAIAITDVDKYKGQVKLSGEVWSAKSNGATIPEGRTVKVVKIDGATAIVE